jgi:hypothetical protein
MSDDDDEETFDDVTEVHRFFRPLLMPPLFAPGYRPGWNEPKSRKLVRRAACVVRRAKVSRQTASSKSEK